MELTRSTHGIFLFQKKYALELLQDTGLTTAKPISCPLDPAVKLQKLGSDLFHDPTAYRRLIGRLVYLTNTRPDISFSVGLLSQFMDKPMIEHHQAALRILKYVKMSPSLGLFFPTVSDHKLTAFADADWGSCLDTRRSTTGYCFFYGQALLSWKSKKQHTVARSSAEAEYRSLAAATCEAQWLSYLLADLHLPVKEPITLFCDNRSAIHIANNPVFHERTKHIDMDCHIVREKVLARLIHLLPIASHQQTADIFTKTLHPEPFSTLLTKLNLKSFYG